MRSPLITISMESTINKLSVSQQHNLITIPLDNRNVRIYDINGNRICRLSRDSHSRMVTCATWLPNAVSTVSAVESGCGPSSAASAASSSTNLPSGVISPNQSSAGSNSNTALPGAAPNLNLFTCAFDRRVCAWSIVSESK